MYAVTSLTSAQSDAVELARYLRGRWHVENKLHWVKDISMGEDASRIRTGGGPRMMASLRNLVLSLLRLNGHTNIAKALRRNATRPKRAITLITTSWNATLPQPWVVVLIDHGAASANFSASGLSFSPIAARSLALISAPMIS